MSMEFYDSSRHFQCLALFISYINKSGVIEVGIHIYR